MSLGAGKLRFWGRRCRIESGNTVLFQYSKGHGLRITAEVNRSSNPEPDTATIRVINVSTQQAKQLVSLLKQKPMPNGEVQAVRIKLFAGYDEIGVSGLEEMIYTGDILDVSEGRPDGGTETVLEITCGDGFLGQRDGYLNESFGPGVGVDLVRKSALAAMQIADGIDAQLAMKEALGKNAEVAAFRNGYVAQARAKDTMSYIATLLGLKWWVRDGVLVMVQKHKATNDTAIVLTANTGLLGDPKVKETGDLEFRALLNPKIFPGRQIIVEKSGAYIGAPTYRVDSVRYLLDTDDTPWHVEGLARQVIF